MERTEYSTTDVTMSMGLSHVPEKASVDRIAVGCRKLTRPRIKMNSKANRRLYGGALVNQ